jgi:hypothetical protein
MLEFSEKSENSHGIPKRYYFEWTKRSSVLTRPFSAPVAHKLFLILVIVNIGAAWWKWARIIDRFYHHARRWAYKWMKTADFLNHGAFENEFPLHQKHRIRALTLSKIIIMFRRDDAISLNSTVSMLSNPHREHIDVTPLQRWFALKFVMNNLIQFRRNRMYLFSWTNGI